MATGPGGGRLRTVGVAAALLGMVLAGCAKAAPASTAGQTTARKLNPAQTAAFEIIRVQSIVPFTAAQDQQLEPMLSALAKDPKQTAAQLAADAKQITAVFTATQQTALKNAGLGSVTATGNGFGRGGFAGGHFRGTRPHVSGTGPRKFSGAGGGRPAAFRGSFVYTLALDTLEGKRPTLGPRPGASGTGGTTAGSAAGSQSATGTGTTGGGATATA